MILYTTSLEVSRHTSRAVFDLCRNPIHMQVVVTQPPFGANGVSEQVFRRLHGPHSHLDSRAVIAMLSWNILVTVAYLCVVTVIGLLDAEMCHWI